jgi:two-component system phosphoglycerate transport system sensor histidine kinase PgtB
VQNEQQQVYTLARIENQIVDDLRDRLNELKSGNDDGMLVETHIRYLENLKKRRMKIFVRWMTGRAPSPCDKRLMSCWKLAW